MDRFNIKSAFRDLVFPLFLKDVNLIETLVLSIEYRRVNGTNLNLDINGSTNKLFHIFDGIA